MIIMDTLHEEFVPYFVVDCSALPSLIGTNRNSVVVLYTYSSPDVSTSYELYEFKHSCNCHDVNLPGTMMGAIFVNCRVQGRSGRKIE